MTEMLIVPRRESGVSLFLALVSGKIAPGPLWHKPSYRAKFLLRSLLYPVTSCRHMHEIAALPVMRQTLPVQSTLPGKVHRPYLHQALSASQRACALSDHYHFVDRLRCHTLRSAMLSARSTALVRFSGKEGEQFSVDLSCSGRCEREGEVNLLLRCDGICLAVLTFSVIGQREQPVLFIGGIQGAQNRTPHELIRLATRACYGLFPKRILLEIITLLAAATGISAIQAVSDRGHIYRSLRYRYKKKDLFLASYDEFWLSVKASPISREIYQLPLRFEQKPLESIASKKRAEYRRRYLLLDDLSQQFAQWS